MAIVSDAQYGMVDEVTFGTAATVSRFLEYNEQSMKQNIERIESAGKRPSRRVLPSTHRQTGRAGAEGDVEFEIHNKGFGLPLKHMMGTIATSNPDAASSPTVYEHFATVGPLDSKSFTCQLGRTGTDGTTRAFTYSGCKVAEWEISCEVDGTVMLKLSIDSREESTGVALASASYATATIPLTWMGGSVTIAGSEHEVTNATLSGNNGLKTDRFFMSATSPGKKRVQLEATELREYTGSLEADFIDLTAYNRFVNGDIVAVTYKFEGGVIEDAFKYALEITLPAVQFDGETPDDDDVPKQSLPFKVLDNADPDGPVQLLYRTSDAVA